MIRAQLLPWSIEAVRQGGWPAIALFVFHVIAANAFDAYGRFPRLDIPMHFLGGVVIAYFFHRASIAASRRGLAGPFHRGTHAVLVFSLTCVATVFWEFGEFVADRAIGTHAQLGLEDTMGDLLVGLCGGLAMLVATQLRPRRER